MNKKIILVLFVVLVLGCAGGIGYLAATNQKASAVVSKTESGDTQSQQSNNNAAEAADTSDTTGLTITDDTGTYKYNTNLKTFLFLGIDKKQEVTLQDMPGNGGQSDCLILFVEDSENHTTTMVEIPRDSMVDVDLYDAFGKFYGKEHAQLTLQYAYGDGEKKSCWLTKKKVTELFGDKIRIDGYMSLNIDGISTLNDAMGGVTLTVPEDYTSIDPAFIQGNTITLAGPQAELYVRSRDCNVTGSNMDRMERQTQYLNALFSQMNGKMDTATLTKLQKDASPYMVSDLSIDQLKQIANYSMNEESYTVPGEVTEGAEHDEFVVNYDDLQEIIKKVFYKSVN